ncbi:MAG TPA: hypothetical protein VJ964_01880 [Balneolaceae bacterium]|nr:hypothetical protein [Balneolaceae bacterium]
MDIHDIDIEYNALPMTAFWDRSYRAFGGGDVLFPRLKPGVMVWTVPAGDFKTRFTTDDRFTSVISEMVRPALSSIRSY